MKVDYLCILKTDTTNPADFQRERERTILPFTFSSRLSLFLSLSLSLSHTHTQIAHPASKVDVIQSRKRYGCSKLNRLSS